MDKHFEIKVSRAFMYKKLTKMENGEHSKASCIKWKDRFSIDEKINKIDNFLEKAFLIKWTYYKKI